jgi:hypothetical protein
MYKRKMAKYSTTVIHASVLLLLFTASSGVNAEAERERHNSFSVFVGNTQNGSENGATIGLGYERRLNSLVGVGAFLERAGGDFGVVAVGVPVILHPHAGWAFKLAPGVEFDDGSRSLLLRAGLSYDFEVVPRWSIAPEFNADFVDGETELVYGVSVAYEF